MALIQGKISLCIPLRQLWQDETKTVNKKVIYYHYNNLKNFFLANKIIYLIKYSSYIIN